ncbi:APC family permease [Actinospica sp.]|jgi:amino acid transporter|uniref:APC family permease n=1 Tax=Actinospica sp. TaxID=1872142 RepID=UPI002B9EB4B1|nr:APC family permease [Actinospica sp.]HWG24814.1 APC family permease [Actinospica sp.]
MTTRSQRAAAADATGHRLRGESLGRFDSTVMAVAGTAPAYSIAGTTAALVGAVAYAGPAALLYCGIPMLGIAFAFSYLTRVDVNAGASYSWVARALHPALGFIAGWALVVSALIFMVIGSLPAGTATLSLFSASAAANTTDTLIVGAIWFLVMLALVGVGVRITAHAQWIMTGVEVAILLVFGLVALFRSGHVTHFSWHWFSLGAFHGGSGFAAGALVAAFYYWGWDVTCNLSEETKRAWRTTGTSGLVGVLISLGLFELFAVVVNLNLTSDQINSNAANVLSALGNVVWAGTGGKIMVVAVMLSTVATLETTLIQVSRSLFAMGRDHTLPRALGRVHPRRQTPLVALGVVGVISLVLFVLSNKVGSLGTIMSDAFSAIGLQICVYYSLAAIAVIVAYRKVLLKSVGNAVFIGLWPLLGAVFMAWVFVQALPTLTAETKEIGLGALALGLIPLVWFWRKGSSYYRTERLEVSLDTLVGENEAEHDGILAAATRSGAPDDVLATDL